MLIFKFIFADQMLIELKATTIIKTYTGNS